METLITVHARSENKREATIWCGACGYRGIPLVFYERAGLADLDGARLWISHYDRCRNLPGAEDMTIILGWDDGRPNDTYVFSPATRMLRRTG